MNLLSTLAKVKPKPAPEIISTPRHAVDDILLALESMQESRESGVRSEGCFLTGKVTQLLPVPQRESQATDAPTLLSLTPKVITVKRGALPEDIPRFVAFVSRQSLSL